MKKLLLPTLVLLASAASAETFVSADVSAQLAGLTKTAHTLAQAARPDPRSTILPRALTEEGLIGIWEVMRYDAEEPQGFKVSVDYADPATARGETRMPGAAAAPLAVPYTARGTHSFSRTNGRRVFRQSMVQSPAPYAQSWILFPGQDRDGSWEAQANAVIYGDAAGNRELSFTAVYTGPVTLRLTATTPKGARITIDLRRAGQKTLAYGIMAL